MAGHSKWHNMRHRKARQDAKRVKIFTKLIREITVAAKSSPNVADNPRLRAAVEDAFYNNMKRDSVEKAIARGAGSSDADNYEELTYEGYGINGVAFIVECMTDNRNRTAGEVRHAFDKKNGNLGTSGSVSYLFSRKGQISFVKGVDENALMEAALEAGADDVVTNEDGSFDVMTTFEDYLGVKDTLLAIGFKPEHSEIVMLPSLTVSLDKDQAEKILALIDALEDLDDVQKVYTNADISEEIMEQLDT
ncbi:MAG: YebC/PmpR family DNA-binding transcriptional regulator [Moraxellaceae bacterium]|nr:MAG: YebC/PmpR family DNA-binding transcriptional regulator [Moraxellaceae bacterium]